MAVSDAAYFVDANVPMYAVGSDHPLKRSSIRVLEAVAAGEIVAVTDAEVHQEILHRYTAVGERERAMHVSSLFLRAVPDVLSITRADVEATVGLLLAHKRLPVRDAVHAAIMTRHSIRDVISADRHFDLIPGIVRHDPSRWA